MKRFSVALAAVCLWNAPLQARESYEAKPGLIAPGGLVIFFNSQGPLSYESLSKRDLPHDAVDAGDVAARSCQYGLSLPLSLSAVRSGNVSGVVGNGSYQKALAQLHARRPELRGIYNMIVDLQVTSVLGVFSRLCTDMTARGYR